MQTGEVRMWNADKGYGFIMPHDGGPEIFAHISRCVDGIEALRAGTLVRYVVRESRRKPGSYEAVDVLVI